MLGGNRGRNKYDDAPSTPPLEKVKYMIIGGFIATVFVVLFLHSQGGVNQSYNNPDATVFTLKTSYDPAYVKNFFKSKMGSGAAADSETSSATSGKLFSVDKKRTYETSQFVFSGKNAKKAKVSKAMQDLLKYSGPPCTHWSVTTTIFEPSEAMQIQANLGDDWCLVVAGDKKGWDEYPLKRQTDNSASRIVYLSAKMQNKYIDGGIDLVSELPWNHFGRKNVGYLYAIANGAEYIWDFDDDNGLLDEKAKTILTPCNDESYDVVTVLTPNNDCQSYNPYPAMGAVNEPVWPRGLPLDHIKDPKCVAGSSKTAFKREALPRSRLVVCQSLAQYDPDVDAIYRLTRPLPFMFAEEESYKMPVRIPRNSLAPFNAQATMFQRKAFWMLLLPISVHGRVSDIWRSYAGQRLLREANLDVVFIQALVIQVRNAHNYLGDLQSEIPLYTKADAIIQFLLEWKAPASVTFVELVEMLYVELYEREFIEIEDVKLMQIWLTTLVKIGYEFPQRT